MFGRMCCIKLHPRGVPLHLLLIAFSAWTVECASKSRLIMIFLLLRQTGGFIEKLAAHLYVLTADRISALTRPRLLEIEGHGRS